MAFRDDIFGIAEPLLVRIASTPRVARTGGPPADSPSRVLAAVADPLLREAIEVASGSLGGYLDRLDTGVELAQKRLTRVALATTRYALRGSGRSTPFGLFAGVATARLGPAARAVVRGPGEKSVRLDGAWLHDKVRTWLASPQVRRRIDVVVNDLCRIRGGRLVRSWPEPEVSVRATGLVEWVLERASHPISYDHLLKLAVERLPGVPAERIDATLAQLIQNGFLLTSITPQRIDDGFLDRLDAVIEPEAAVHLREIRSALAAYRKAEPGKGLQAWRHLRRLVDPRSAEQRTPVQVDLRMDADITLPHTVADEARRYAAAMWAISPAWRRLAYIRAYRDRFIDRYGSSAVVPLGELIDPHRGLGLPAFPADTFSDHDGDDDDARERRLLTAELVHRALSSEDRVLTLTDAEIDELSATPDDVPPPRSLELQFQLLAASPAAIDRGDFRLVSGVSIGSWVAGAIAGRFAELMGITPGLSGVIKGGSGEETLIAQVTFHPRHARLLNVVQVPRLLPHEIPVGVYADRADPGCLDWRRLLVGVEPHGMCLLQEGTGRRVIPVVPHMAALDHQAPPQVRLLADLALARTRAWTGWEWWGTATLPVRPRVTYGRVVIAPMHWRPDRSLIAAATAGPATWDQALPEWRDRYRVPDRVQVVRFDHAYGIDLRDPWHRTLLRDDLARAEGRLMLAENLAADETAFGWTGGHSTEVVIPLVRRASAPSPGKAAVVRERPIHLPGEDWLFAKLYAHPTVHNALIAGQLPAFLREVTADVDRWFFIRYLDPDSHLRLRLHGDAETLRTRVQPALTRHARAMLEAGLIRTMLLDAYEPETGRYGDAEALEAAERLFCLDSYSAIAQLGQPVPDVPDEVLAAAGYALLLESMGDDDWCSWVERVFPRSPGPHRALAADLIRPGRVAERVTEWAPTVGRLWAEATEPRAYADTLPAEARDEAVLSLLHMQHNRLIGIDPEKENRSYAVLRSVAQAHNARLRALRRGAAR